MASGTGSQRLRLWLRFVFSLLLVLQLGVYAHKQYDAKDQLQQPMLRTGSNGLARSVKKVAVIGAGAGGASAAYYLQRFAANNGYDVDITVYEKSSYIGGRSTTVNVYGNPEEPVELGASIFVAVNECLTNATKEFGLEVDETYISRRQAKDALGVYDGKSFVFRQPYNTTWWSNLAIIWKYGLAPIRSQQLMKQTVGKFLQFYKAPVFPFRSLSEAVEQVDLLEATSHTGEQFLEMHGLSGKFSTDLIQASTRVNYAQNLGLIHGLETMVCMATDGAMSVKGGNWRIFKGMVDASKAKLRLNTAVTKLNKPSPQGKWVVHTTSISDPKDSKSAQVHAEEFDQVILASPYQFSAIDIHPKLEKVPDEIPYVSLHVTLFTSPLRLSPEYFNLPPGDEVPDMLLTTLNATEQQDETTRRGEGPNGVGNTGIFSISLLRKIEREVNGLIRTEYLYKIFSPTYMSHDRIKEFFGAKPEEGSRDDADDSVITWSHKKAWFSYPYVYPRVTFEDIILDKKQTLFYISGIESFISTMETSSLMGMNVAQLLIDSWDRKRKYVKIEPEEELNVKAKL